MDILIRKFNGYFVDMYAGPVDGMTYLWDGEYLDVGDEVLETGIGDQMEGWYIVCDVEGKKAKACFKQNPDFRI